MAGGERAEEQNIRQLQAVRFHEWLSKRNRQDRAYCWYRSACWRWMGYWDTTGLCPLLWRHGTEQFSLRQSGDSSDAIFSDWPVTAQFRPWASYSAKHVHRGSGTWLLARQP